MSDLRTITERNRKADCSALGIPYVTAGQLALEKHPILAAQRKQRDARK